MTKLCTLLLAIILIFTLFGCNGKNASGSTATSTKTTDKSNVSRSVISANAPKPIAILTNPNTMDLETTARSASEIASEKPIIEAFAEEFLQYAARNGIDKALKEVNKAKEGVFKKSLVGPFYYLPICKMTADRVYTIMAHVNPDFVGVDLNLDKWQDLTGWQYITSAYKKYTTGETNRVWVDGVYWKDNNWAGGKPIKFSSFERFYKIEGDEYLFHYCQFLYQ